MDLNVSNPDAGMNPHLMLAEVRVDEYSDGECGAADKELKADGNQDEKLNLGE